MKPLAWNLPPKQIAFAAMLLTLIIDQLSKLWVVDALANGKVIEVAPFFRLVQVWNHGVSFGMFNHGGGVDEAGLQRGILTLLTLVIVVFLFNWLRRTEKFLPAMGLGLIIGGAIGNLVDRFHYGAVADFLDFHVQNHHWPAFNVADSCIVIGVGLLLLDNIMARDKSISFASGDKE